MSPDTDRVSEPLEWWRLHERNFLRVSKLAKKYLPPAPLLKSFLAKGVNVVTCTRVALKRERMNQLVFAHNL